MKYKPGDEVEVTSMENPSEWLPAELEGPRSDPELFWVRIFFPDGMVGRGLRFRSEIRPRKVEP